MRAEQRHKRSEISGNFYCRKMCVIADDVSTVRSFVILGTTSKKISQPKSSDVIKFHNTSL